MKMIETEKTRKFCSDAKKFNVKTYTFSASQRQSYGISDRAIAHTYWCGFVEFKNHRTPIQKTQEMFVDFMNKDGRLKAVIVRFDEEGWLSGQIVYPFHQQWDGILDLLEKLKCQAEKSL